MRSRIPIAFLFFMLLKSVNLFGQTTLVFDPATLKHNPVNLFPHSYVFEDATCKLEFEEVIHEEMLPFDEAKDRGLFSQGFFERNLWFKVLLEPENRIKANEIAIHFPNAARIEIYEMSSEGVHFSSGGRFISVNSSQIKRNKYAFPLRETDAVVREIYVKVSALDRFKKELSLVDVANLEQERLDFRKDRFVEINYFIALISIFGFTGFLILIQFFQTKESYMLWYSLYLIGLSFYFLEFYEYISWSQIFFERFSIIAIFHRFIGPILFYFLTFYIRDILEIHRKHVLRKYYRFLLYSAHFTFFTALTFLLFSGFFPVSESVRIIFVLPFLLTSTAFALRSILSKDKINKIVGSGLLAISIACFLLVLIFLLSRFGHYHILFEFALLIELCLLNAAIGYKVRLVNNNLVQAQKNLLTEEKKNLEIQKKLNEELNELVEAKTKDILTQNKKIALQESLKVEAEFKEKIANAELKALKAQMNPHFIFNCLNAIRNLILKEENDKATQYLGVFSSFIRKVLTYSEVRSITLEEEIDLSKLYLKMEQLRFEEGFDFEVLIEPGSAIDFVKVPPMLLQPILENAIWHGLLHKEGKRFIKIRLSHSEGSVLCTIEDNGIGRKAAQSVIKSRKEDSMGLKLFNDRLQIKNTLSQQSYNYEIVDMYENGEACGTKVKLYFEI